MNAIRGWVLLLSALPATPDALARAPDPPALRQITEAERRSWEVISNALLSPDGKWLAYSVTPADPRSRHGKVEIVSRSVDGEEERRYAAGDADLGAGTLRMSASGRWIAFHAARPLQETNGSRRPGRVGVVAVELATGKRFEFPDVQDFSFAGSADELILLRGYPNREGESAFTLSLRKPNRSAATTWGGIEEFAIDPSRRRLAMIDAQGVRVHDTKTGRTRVLETGLKSDYRGLTWTVEGASLAVFRRESTRPTAGAVIVAFSKLNSDRPVRKVLDPRYLPGFPEGYEITSEDAVDPESPVAPARPAIVWREDGNGLFLGLRPVAGAKEEPRMAVRENPARDTNLVLWHWRDPKLPGQRRAAARADATFAYLGFVSLADGRFVGLADPALPMVTPHVRGRHVLGYNIDRYDSPSNPNLIGTGRSAQYRDYSLVDLRNGERTVVARRLLVMPNPRISVPPQLSPDGRYVLFQDDGDYFTYEIASGERRNLTAGLPTRFYYEQNFKNKRHFRDRYGGPVLQGWAHDGKHVLITDYHDVWVLPLGGGRALNLTGTGRRQSISYERANLERLSPDFGRQDDISIDLGKPMYFRSFDWHSANTGIARRQPGSERVEPLWQEAANTFYYKAAHADVYLVSRMTAAEPGDYYLAGSDWRPEKRLTDVNPQQRELRWSPPSKYLTYIVPGGDTLHAALRLPAGYAQGERYPTIVSIYERRSSGVHGFSFPSAAEFDWLQHGYAVLYPDIQPMLNEPGRAALEGVLAAVDAAVKTGIVDRENLALTGHSYGGYETYFILTQTNIFKAAVPQSGWSNLWSAYGAVWADRIPASHLMEHEQTYMAGPWWDHWDAYIRNSPLFHARNITTPLLIVHGTRDRAVRFSQAEEMFNALRRMGDKAVVLLEYREEDHTFENAQTREDISHRMLAFFDHFLKGAPAPDWWSGGVSRYR